MQIDRLMTGIGAVLIGAAGVLAPGCAQRPPSGPCQPITFVNVTFGDLAEAYNLCSRNRLRIQMIGPAAEMRWSAHVKLDDAAGLVQLVAHCLPQLIIERDGDVVTISARNSVSESGHRAATGPEPLR